MRSPNALLLAAAAATLSCSGAKPTTGPAPRASAAPAHASVRGTVRDASHRPVEGAVVALVREVDLRGAQPDNFITRTDARGTFEVEPRVLAELGPGHYAITVTARGFTATYGEAFDLDAHGARTFAIELGRGGHRFTGIVRDERGPVRGVTVCAIEISPRDLSTYSTVTDASGRYDLTLAEGLGYIAEVAAPPRGRATRILDPSLPDNDLTLEPAPAPRPADAEMRAAIDARAMPIATDDPTAPLEDLEPIVGAIGGARIVAIGEATHGSRELYRIRHRLFEALVERAGFTVFGVEAGYAEARAIDAYVLGGDGDPRALLHGTLTDYLQTEEWLALIVWMRAYNAETRHKQKLRFAGFDITTFTAVKAIVEASKRISTARAKEVEAALAPLARYDADATFAAEPSEVRARVASTVASLRVELERVAGANDTIAHDLDMLEQATVIFVNPLLRDAMMARNVEWLVDHAGGARVVLSMHDSHASHHRAFEWEMGARLSEKYDKQYAVIGTAFGRGGFRSLGKDASRGVQQLAVEAPAPGGLEASLDLAKPALYALDLRAMDGAVGAWLASPVPSWNIGFRFVDAASAVFPLVPKASYDLVVYVREVTAARALPPK